MKQEWNKDFKNIYLPGAKPETINVPPFNFFTIEGSGDPNKEDFELHVKVLYTLTYTIRMSFQAGTAHKNFFEYKVFPLEGIWDFEDLNKINKPDGSLNKDNLKYKMMIRQPDFVDKNYANQIIEEVKAKKSPKFIEKVQFENIEDGFCVQMMHKGSYDNECHSFQIIDKFIEDNNLKRQFNNHKEIYIGDPKKSKVENLKTVLRVKVKRL